ncbi:2-(3-amino-3-carboxypropyl)histidine synthase subunit 2 [Linum grandiflorum]
MRVVGALRDKLQLLKQTEQKDGGAKQARLLLMADATFGSCCVNEVGASHIDAECVVHYGHTCLIPTSTVPAFFVLGKASMGDESLSNYASSWQNMPTLFLE